MWRPIYNIGASVVGCSSSGAGLSGSGVLGGPFYFRFVVAGHAAQSVLWGVMQGLPLVLYVGPVPTMPIHSLHRFRFVGSCLGYCPGICSRFILTTMIISRYYLIVNTDLIYFSSFFLYV